MPENKVNFRRIGTGGDGPRALAVDETGVGAAKISRRDRLDRSPGVAIVWEGLVPEVGLEPTSLSAGDFESPASTNSATRALERLITEASDPRPAQMRIKG